MIDAKLLSLWKSIARQDNCFNLLVPSDIRQMIGEIERLDHAVYFYHPDVMGKRLVDKTPMHAEHEIVDEYVEVAVQRYREMNGITDDTIQSTRPERSDDAGNL